MALVPSGQFVNGKGFEELGSDQGFAFERAGLQFSFYFAKRGRALQLVWNCVR